MSEKTYTVVESGKGYYAVKWEGLKLGDWGKSFSAPMFADKSVQVFGTFGASGQVNVEGSLEEELTSTATAEKVTNGTFTGSATGWTFNDAIWSYNANAIDKDADGTGTLEQDVSAVVGELYKLTYQIPALSVTGVTPTLGGVAGTARSTAGWFTDYILATTTGNLIFTPLNLSRFTLDNISVVKSVRWATLNDPQGNVLNLTAEKIEAILENVVQVRPFVTVGDEYTDLTVFLLIEG